jgi:hypothetical protein
MSHIQKNILALSRNPLSHGRVKLGVGGNNHGHWAETNAASYPTVRFSEKQYQQVIDKFAVGRIRWVRQLPMMVTRMGDTTILLNQVVLRTTKGLYLLVAVPDNQIRHLWSLREFQKLLKQMCGMNAAVVVTQPDTSNVQTAHKFYTRFTLFGL